MALDLPIILGNWKMHGLKADGLALADALVARARGARMQGTLGILPPATLLAAVADRCAGTGIVVGGQDCHPAAEGAHTGSVAAEMLADAGAGMVLAGHSERRHGLGEDDALVRAKALAARRAGLVAVVCVGETEDQRRQGEAQAVIERQLEASLPPEAADGGLIVAYEPVWAIGSGNTAEVRDIAMSHGLIRARLAALFGDGARIPILYGGSVKAANAAAILATQDVDGVLVGGASLDGAGFWSIFEAGAAP